MKKEKLNFEEQITYLKDKKGITFKHVKEDVAKEILENNTYYYKVTCYKRNFRKSSDGKYSNLDFGQLYDLSIIDTNLRQVLGKMCLNLEHSLKAKIMSLITNSQEDGYTIVYKYSEYDKSIFRNDKNKDTYKDIFEKILVKTEDKHDYDYKLFSKYQDYQDIPLWVLLEKMGYGDLIKFIRFYVYKKYPFYKELVKADLLLIMTKRIRNACFHNRPLLMNFANAQHSGSLALSSLLKTELNNYHITSESNRSEYRKTVAMLENTKVHDIFCLILLYKEYVTGSKINKYLSNDIKLLLDRFNKNRHEYDNNRRIHEIFDLMVKFFNII